MDAFGEYDINENKTKGKELPIHEASVEEVLYIVTVDAPEKFIFVSQVAHKMLPTELKTHLKTSFKRLCE